MLTQHHSQTSTVLCAVFYSSATVPPRGDGPLPEVGAILGQPVKETKQAFYILQDTKI